MKQHFLQFFIFMFDDLLFIFISFQLMSHSNKILIFQYNSLSTENRTKNPKIYYDSTYAHHWKQSSMNLNLFFQICMRNWNCCCRKSSVPTYLLKKAPKLFRFIGFYNRLCILLIEFKFISFFKGIAIYIYYYRNT